MGKSLVQGTGRALVLAALLLSACGHAPASFASLGNGAEPLRVADAAMKGGAPTMALQVTRSILAHDPGDAAAWNRQGDALFELRRFGEARLSYRRALKLRPGDEASRLGIARLDLQSDPAKAEHLLVSLLQDDRSNAAAQNDLGIARDLQGRHRDAQLAYQTALSIAPDMVAAQVNLGLSLALSGSSQRALELLQPIALGPDATPRMQQDFAAALAMAGHPDDARRILDGRLAPGQVAQAVSGYESLREAAR